MQVSIEPDNKLADWFQATTLVERLATLANNNRPGPGQSGAKRLQRWRSQSFKANSALFEQRLAADNLTQSQLMQILGESLSGLQSHFDTIPDWVKDLQQALTEPYTLQEASLPLSETVDPTHALFLELVRPLIGQARRRLREGVARLAKTAPEAAFELETVEDILLEGVDYQLLNLISPTLALEMQVARLSGRLESATPEGRFEDFIKILRQPQTPGRLLREYAVLARQVYTILHNRVNYGLEFLNHLCADWSELSARFSQGLAPGPLTRLQTSLGDSHCDSKTVLSAEFASGLQLIYKPHSLAVDVHFQQLLQWFNRFNRYAPFYTLNILNRPTYGWVEFIKPAACANVAELGRFYYRQGGFLAILYLLGASDFHYGNLIAAGEHPILLDLEALFNPILSGADEAGANAVANQALAYSVLRVGLLPERMWLNKDSAGIEMSGIGGEEGQLSPQPIPVWENLGTDEMRLVYKRLKMPAGKNRPGLPGVPVNPLDYLDNIVAGFSDLYRQIVRERPGLLADTGPLVPFALDPVRVVLRNTRSYELIVEKSGHPDRLRDALERDCLFDRLWYNTGKHPHLARIISAERRDLEKGDIPYFSARPCSTSLWTSTGQIIENYSEQSGMDSVRQRLERLDEIDLSKQLWFIRASLTIISSDSEHPTWPTYQLDQVPAGFSTSREQLVAQACAIGDRLEKLAMRGTDDITWIGLSVENLEYWYLTPLNLTLYDGLPGVALFLAYLGHSSGEERFSALARAILPGIRQQVAQNRGTLNKVGSFEGWGGVIYALAHLGTLWNEPALLEEARDLVNLLPPLIEKDKFLDIITGAAGCLGVLLALYKIRPDPFVMEVARQCGDLLVERAIPQEVGLAWHTPMPATQAATGFGRGSSGISWALLQLAAACGDEKYRKTGFEALSYERSVFSATVNNWPDFRTAGKPALPKGFYRYMTAWCHGAPGIGLARLSLLSSYNDPQIQAEVAAAVSHTLNSGFGANHSLCHGDLGNLELLLAAAQSSQDAELIAKVGALTAAIAASIDRSGGICSTPLQIETPGLMVGLAGIGYELLRLADPWNVPSVLILEPPRLQKSEN